MNRKLLLGIFERFKKYNAWLARQPLSPHTKRAYRTRLNHFLGFVGTSFEDYGNVLTDSNSMKKAVLSYKRYLKQLAKTKPTSINTTLAAIDHFIEYIGLPATKVEREDLPKSPPLALDTKQQAKFRLVIETCESTRNRALGLLLMNSGLRIGECARLNVQDVSQDAGVVTLAIRNGKGNVSRKIPIDSVTSDALRNLLNERRKLSSKAQQRALFLNRFGKRMSTAGIDLIVRDLGNWAGLDVSAHVLRHTCLSNLIKNGNDLSSVAKFGGHKRLETTKRYQSLIKSKES